jgi:hypothetical protein
MELTEQRLQLWWKEFSENVRTGRWWLILVPLVLWLISGVLEHRLFGWLNTFIDNHAAGLARWLTSIGSFEPPLLGLAVTLAFFLGRAFLTSAPGIVGNADLMVQELEIADIDIVDEGASYTIDLAAFARMEVASLDRPRTVTRFEIEMVAPDKTVYRANSEYELGRYFHKYEITNTNEWGAVTSRSVREPMEDLAAKLRTPIQPYTHVGRAWVRFELTKVRHGHEPKNCRIRIFAVDPSGRKHEIATDAMQVKAIGDDHEYAAAITDSRYQ